MVTVHPLIFRFRLSSGSDDSGAEDERYDNEEEKIYRKEKQDQDGGTAGRDQDGGTAGRDQDGAAAGSM